MGETLHKHQEENDINLGKLGKGFPLHIVNGGNSFTSPSLYNEVSPTTEEPKISSSPIRSPSDVFRESKIFLNTLLLFRFSVFFLRVHIFKYFLN